MTEVFKDEDGYWFYDETLDLIGPFQTAEQAQIAYDASARWEARDHKDKIHKMRIYYD